MKYILIILLFISSVSQAQNFGAGRPAYLRGVVITSNFDSIYVRTAAGNGPLSVISKADFITGLGISVAAAGGEHEIQFNNSDVFTASDQFLYIASQNRLVVGGASSLSENLLLNKSMASIKSDFIVMANNTGAGRIKFGDALTSGFSPYMQMIADGTTGDNSFVLFNSNNTGSVASAVFRAQNLAGSGTLSSQPLFDFQNYTTSVMNIDAGGRVGINQTSQAASSILDVVSTTKGVLIPRMTNTQMNAISSPATGLMVINTDTIGTATGSGIFIYTGSAWVGIKTSTQVGGGGDVYKVGTPVNNEVGIWTGDGTIEGDADLTFNGTSLTASGSMYATAFFPTEAGSMSTPAGGKGVYYFKTDNLPYAMNDAGTEMPLYNVLSITESTYSPTLTNTTNIAASTAYTTYYIRIGDYIHVWGDVSIDATAATTISEMGMSLPVASAVGNTYELAGTASFEDNTSVQIKGDVANGRAMFRFTPQSATNNKYSFHFSYKYIAP